MNEPYEVFTVFRAAADTENAMKMAAYMKNLFPFLGIPTPRRKALSKTFLTQAKKRPALQNRLTGTLSRRAGTRASGSFSIWRKITCGR
jgi:3-methyladenine DNA glycosylase AlkD